MDNGDAIHIHNESGDVLHRQYSIYTGKDDPSTLFDDGKKKIDFVLVIEDQKREIRDTKATNPEVPGSGDTEVTEEMQKIQGWRQTFMTNLQKSSPGIIREMTARLEEIPGLDKEEENLTLENYELPKNNLLEY